MPISKPFRIATEGQTTDGRELTRAQIQQMAESYSKEMYAGRCNLEHFISIMPNSPFKAYGDIVSLSAKEVEEGPLKGKLGLYAVADVSDELVTLHKDKQKLYTSIEMHPKFADTGKAYCMGLAFTDTPASLGTEIMKFSSQNPDANPFAHRKTSPETLFSSAELTELDFEHENTASVSSVNTPSIFSKVKQMFSNKNKMDDERFSDVHQAVELVAQSQTELQEKYSQTVGELTQAKNDLATLTESFNQLKTQLEKTEQVPEQFSKRPIATGDMSEPQTDC